LKSTTPRIEVRSGRTADAPLPALVEPLELLLELLL
jgi:hypothetical protein